MSRRSVPRVCRSTTARGLSQLAAALAGAEGVSVASSNTGELVYSFPPRLREELNVLREQRCDLRWD